MDYHSKNSSVLTDHNISKGENKFNKKLLPILRWDLTSLQANLSLFLINLEKIIIIKLIIIILLFMK